nr:Dihydroxy-acid dehydratase [Kibdelosporangium sp. MJ126-NF4]CTQ97666.1 Dihydroxy-acid dehydratase (EC 4.2.1.9) [Kibdelosporangium sp. MJ126-NF4]
MTGKPRQQLRSARWYAETGLRSFSHRTRARQSGIGAAEHTGKPVIGIVNTWSEASSLMEDFCRAGGGPGVPEHGMLPSPQSLLRQGIRDMVRISDARMSGTSFGTCVPHVAPESYVGGPLALVENGDPITPDVPGYAALHARARRDMSSSTLGVGGMRR